MHETSLTINIHRAWQINEINGINDITEINDGLINLCKLGLGLMRINDGLMKKVKGPINPINLSLIRH